MFFLARRKRQDLVELAQAFDVTIQGKFKDFEIRDAIVNSPTCDAEFAKEHLNRIIDDRKELEQHAERENERLFELEKL